MKELQEQRWHEIERIFEAAVEHDDADRAAFVQSACAGDDALRREVERLLAADQKAQQIGPRFLASPLRPSHDTKLGAYQLRHEIARGGMGAVWLAERADDQFQQQVAIKLMRAGSEELQRRFQHERQILADLNHPNIARLLDGGTTEDGRPYFVMEYIEGLPLDEYCHQRQLNVRERLQLFRQVCAAVQYAHQHLIIHRDLKPANILVTKDGTPKLLDFGVAKLLQSDLTASHHTNNGLTPMTPAYASPEQVRGEKLTTASDVYSLGVVLYELLTGRSPYQLTTNTFGELAKAICEQEPTRPSMVTKSEVRSQKSEGKRKFAFLPTTDHRPPTTALRGDLDSIVLMALRKEPSARYSSVEQFSSDVQRYLDGLPTLARKGTFAYRAVKYVRRYKVPVAAAALSLLSLLGGIGATMRQAVIAKAAQVMAERERATADMQRQRAEDALTTSEEQRQQAEMARAEADQQRAEAEDQRAFAEKQRRQADEQRVRAETQEQTNRRLLYAAHMNLAMEAWEAPSPDISRMQELLEGFEPEAGRVDLRGFEWYYLRNLPRRGLLYNLAHTSSIMFLSFSQDGKTLLSGARNNGIKLWDVNTGQEFKTLLGNTSDVWSMAVSPNGMSTLTTSTIDRRTTLYETTTGMKICGVSGEGGFVVFSPDSKKFATAKSDGPIIIRDAITGKELTALKGHKRTPQHFVFSPDGQSMASASNDGTMRLWDIGSGEELATFNHPQAVYTVAFSPDGKKVASGGFDGKVRLWDITTRKQILTLEISTSVITAMTYSPNGKILATSHGKVIKLWDVISGQELAAIKTGTDIHLAFSPDGRLLASGGDNLARIWDVSAVLERSILNDHTARVNAIAISPDGRRMASGSSDKTIKIWDVQTWRAISTFKGHTDQIMTLAYSPDGRRLASGGYDRSLKLWDAASGQELASLRSHESRIYAVAFSPDGKKLASAGGELEGGGDSAVRIWDVEKAQVIKILKGHGGKPHTGMHRPPSLPVESFDGSTVWSIAFSPDSKRLASASGDSTIKLWDVDSGQELTTLRGHTSQVRTVAFSPDGRHLATGSFDNTAKIWDVASGKELLNLKGHTLSLRSVVFSPNGQRLVTGSLDSTIKLWDVVTGQMLITLKGHTDQVQALAFSPDGNTLVSGCSDKTIRLWRANK